MNLSRNPVVVFGAFILVFWLLLWAGSSGDLLLRGVTWVVLAAMSIVAISKTVRQGRGRRGTYGQDAAMPDRIRRWVYGEPGPEADGRSGQG